MREMETAKLDPSTILSVEYGERLRIYERARDELVARQNSNSQALDRTLITVSSGLLTLSIAFLRLATESPDCKLLLYAGWLTLTLTIVATIVSFHLGNRAIDKRLDFIVEYYLRGKEEFLNKEIPEETWNNRTLIVASSAFISGVLCLLFFFIISESAAVTKEPDENQPVYDDPQTKSLHGAKLQPLTPRQSQQTNETESHTPTNETSEERSLGSPQTQPIITPSAASPTSESKVSKDKSSEAQQPHETKPVEPGGKVKVDAGLGPTKSQPIVPPNAPEQSSEDTTKDD